jgi:hypothetical protein
MGHVMAVARLIADHDPLFNPLGPLVAPPKGLHPLQTTAFFRRADGIAAGLRNTYLRNVLETGLIVTYARPFTKGVGRGFPLSGKRFVPADKRELHRKMLQLRKKVHAHMDAAAPEGFQRSVTREEEPGVSRVTLHGARYLSANELREVAELADEVIERLVSAGGRVMFPRSGLMGV